MAVLSSLEDSHVWSLSTSNVASATEELNFYFFIILTNLNLQRHMELITTISDSVGLAYPILHSFQLYPWPKSQIDLTMACITEL